MGRYKRRKPLLTPYPVLPTREIQTDDADAFLPACLPIDYRKPCSKCSLLLPPSFFWVDMSRPDGLYPSCRGCNNREDSRFARLARLYKVSRERFHEMLEDQGNACAACHQEFTETPAVDHDHGCCPDKHACGRCTRSLLCRGCNTALGLVNDDVERLAGLIEYLTRWNSVTKEVE